MPLSVILATNPTISPKTPPPNAIRVSSLSIFEFSNSSDIFFTLSVATKSTAPGSQGPKRRCHHAPSPSRAVAADASLPLVAIAAPG